MTCKRRRPHSISVALRNNCAYASSMAIFWILLVLHHHHRPSALPGGVSIAEAAAAGGGSSSDPSVFPTPTTTTTTTTASTTARNPNRNSKNPLKLLQEPTRVSGYGSKRYKLPSSVSVATTTTVTTTTLSNNNPSSTLLTVSNNLYREAQQERIVQSKIVANRDALSSANKNLFLQPFVAQAVVDSKETTNGLTTANSATKSLTSTHKLLVHSTQQNATVSIQSISSSRSTTPTSEQANSNRNNRGGRTISPTLQICAVPDEHVERTNNDNNNKNTNTTSTAAMTDLSSWIPVEGLYGVYALPSGHVCVWIVDSEPVYEAPPAPSFNSTMSLSWWQIRRVTELHLTRVVNSDDDRSVNNNKSSKNRAERQEEARQLALLRQALKHHEWYYCCRKNGDGDNFVIPDMTRNLQSCFLRMQQPAQPEPKQQLQDTALSRDSTLGQTDDGQTTWPVVTADAANASMRTEDLVLSSSSGGPPRGGSSSLSPFATAAASPNVSIAAKESETASGTINSSNKLPVEQPRRRRRWWWDGAAPRTAATAFVENANETNATTLLETTAAEVVDNSNATSRVSDQEQLMVGEDRDGSIDRSGASISTAVATEAPELAFVDQNAISGSEVETMRPPLTERIPQRRQPQWWEISNSEHEMQREARELRPDSRFFWNEAAVEPLLELFQQQQVQTQRNNTNSPPVSVLLQHMIPVTSAFCGVQTNLTITQTDNNTASSTICKNNGMAEASSNVRYDQLLITRRGRFRAGTRFTRRGADATGAVANYAETEQVLFVWQPCQDKDDNNDDDRVLRSVASHVQTRGSIPLRWSSPTDIKTYRPRIRIGTDPLAQARAVRQHLVDQASRYVLLPPVFTDNDEDGIISISQQHPALLFVNLIDKHSDQGRLGRALDAVLTAVLDVYSNATCDDNSNDNDFPWLKHSIIQHLWFDFHAEVKSGRWDKLAGLLSTVKPALNEHGYCRVVMGADADDDETASFNNSNSPFRTEQLQTGVVRTNCMDCLDRTNVVQSMFGRYVLFQQLANDLWAKPSLSKPLRTAYRKTPMTLPWTAGEVAHRALWADNADAISRLYAGTPALKGDFTRTGKRTKKGAFDDGMNSLQRYYLNNFLDADRQEGMDLLTGHQPFSSLDGTDSEMLVGDDEDSDDPAVRCLRSKGMSVQEAARQMLLGVNPSVVAYDDDSDSEHARIKVVKRRKRKRDSSSVDMAAVRPTRRSLDLRWLPGDLQAQVRGLVSSSLASSHYSTTDMGPCESSASTHTTVSDLLHAMDERSTSDLPWWVLADNDSSSMDPSDVDDDDGRAASRAMIHEMMGSSANNLGYLVGAFVAGAQKPLTLAALVMGVVALSSFPSTPFGLFPKQEDAGEKRGDDDEGESSEDENNDFV